MDQEILDKDNQQKNSREDPISLVPYMYNYRVLKDDLKGTFMDEDKTKSYK